MPRTSAPLASSRLGKAPLAPRPPPVEARSCPRGPRPGSRQSGGFVERRASLPQPPQQPPPSLQDVGVLTGRRVLLTSSDPAADSAKGPPEVPHEFLCPISQDIMRDAVSTCDGHTYERQSIEEWLEEKTTSPVTGLPLANKMLIPNHNLRKLIRDSGLLPAAEVGATLLEREAFRSDSAGPSRYRREVYAEFVVPRDAPTLADALRLACGRGSGDGASRGSQPGAAPGRASTAPEGATRSTSSGAGRWRPPRTAGLPVPGSARRAALGIRLLPGEHLVTRTLLIEQEVEIIGYGRGSTKLILSPEAALQMRGGARLADLAVSRGDGEAATAPEEPAGRGNNARALLEVMQGSCRIEQVDLSDSSGSAVRVSGAHTSPRIARCTVHGCRDAGIVFQDAADGCLQSCRLFENCSVAIEIHSRADPVVEDNDICDGKQGGVFVHNRGRGHLRRNRVYKNALEGVEVKQGGAPLVEDNDIYHNLECGVFIHDGGEGRVISNRIHSNAFAGVEIKDASSAEVRGNDVYGGRTSGVYVHSGGGGTVEGNQIHQNLLHGVYVRDRGHPHLLKNSIFRNGECGVFVTESSDPCVEHNDISSNSLAGIEVKEHSNPTIKLNRIHDGGTGGVFVLARGRGRILQNHLYSNKLEGIEIKDGGDPHVLDNDIYDNLECGIFAHDRALGRIEGNRIYRNTFAGIEIKDGSRPSVIRNEVYHGHTSGIYVHCGGRAQLTENDVFENKLHGVMVLSGGNPTMSKNKVHDNNECGAIVHFDYPLDLTGNYFYSNGSGDVQAVDTKDQHAPSGTE